MSSTYLSELRHQRRYLANFRTGYGWHTCWFSRETALHALRSAGTVEFRQYSHLSWRRAVFDLFFKPPISYGTGRWACHQHMPRIRHHIVWLRNGGHNWRSNIVCLCRPCHAEIHPWLKETR